MKRLILFTLFLFCATSVFSQEKRTLIVWAEGEKCKEINEDLQGVVCDTFIVDGSVVRSISYQGINVASKVSDNGDNVVGDFYIYNNSEKRILVLSRPSSITLYRSKEEFMNRKDFLISAFAIPPEKIASKIQNKVIWANALNQFGANMQTQQAQINSNGKTATVTMPNTQAQQNAARQNEQRTLEANDKSASILSSALKQNTVFVQSSISGLVYFKRHKKATFGIVFISIDDKDFAFDVESLPKSN